MLTENAFTLDSAINLQQQDHISLYSSHRTLNMSLHYLAKLLLRTCSTFSKSLMVFMGVSKSVKTDMIFVDPGVKINDTYYRDVLLTEQLLPVMCEISGEFFIFQQDSAPVHRACETVSLLEWETTRPESQVVVSRLEVDLAFQVWSSRYVIAPPSELSGAVGFVTSR